MAIDLNRRVLSRSVLNTEIPYVHRTPREVACYLVGVGLVLAELTWPANGRMMHLANLAQAAALLCVVAGTVGMWYLYRLAVALLER